MKKKVLFTFIVIGACFLIFGMLSASAETGTYEDLVYSISNGKITITDCNESATGEIIIPNTIDDYPVTSIDYEAFRDCSNLTKVTIPEQVDYIGPFAFRDCSNLASIAVQGSLTNISGGVFYGCRNLTDITIPESVISIDNWAFSGCSSLTDITIPKSVTSIGSQAFYNCSGLIDITFSDSVTYIDSGAFSGCSSLTNVYYDGELLNWLELSIKDIHSNPMYYAKNMYLKGNLLQGEIVLPDDLTYIRNFAFYNCSGITSIIIPGGITRIGTSSFALCTNLKTVVMNEGISQVYNSAFADCNNLENVSIPKTLSYIGNDAFVNCENITNVYISDIEAWCNIKFSRPSLTDDFFSNPLRYGGKLFLNNILLKEITIPNTVHKISSGAFINCTSLESVIISEGVTQICSNAFYQCANLKSISLPKSLDVIEKYSFYECYGLEKLYIKDIASYLNIDFQFGYSQPMFYADYLYVDNVLISDLNIPNGVTKIPSYAFCDCKNIKKVVIPNSVSNIEKSAFSGCSNLTTVILGNGVEFVDSWAFWPCNNLRTVEYFGTKAEFDAIVHEDTTIFKSYVTIKYECGLPVIIFYNSSGGMNAPASQSTEQNSNVTLSKDIPIKEGYDFLGWSKSADDTKPEYKSGDTITIGIENITLYAIWQRMVVTNTSVINKIIMVTPTNAQKGDCIIVACYMDGKMVYMDTYSYNGETTIPFIPNVKYDTIKIMVWESLSNLKPLGEVEEI